MTAVAIAFVLGVPLVVLVALPRLLDRRARRRHDVVARQIALTDAIHAALGPVVAPIVRRTRRGWVAVLGLPTGYPHLYVVVEIARAELGPTAEIVLVPQPAPRAAVPTTTPAAALAA